VEITAARIALKLLQDSSLRLEQCRRVHECHDVLPKLYEVESAVEGEIHEQEIAESERVVRGKTCCHHLSVTTSTDPARCVDCHSPVCGGFISNGIVCQLSPGHSGVHEALILHYKPRPTSSIISDEERRRETLEWLREFDDGNGKAVTV
jgi:hypothetical protein